MPGAPQRIDLRHSLLLPPLPGFQTSRLPDGIYSFEVESLAGLRLNQEIRLSRRIWNGWLNLHNSVSVTDDELMQDELERGAPKQLVVVRSQSAGQIQLFAIRISGKPTLKLLPNLNCFRASGSI
jgi:hypothetical protein